MVVGASGTVLLFGYQGWLSLLGLLFITQTVAVIVVSALVIRNWVDEERKGARHLAATVLRSRFYIVRSESGSDPNYRAFKRDLAQLEQSGFRGIVAYARGKMIAKA